MAGKILLVNPIGVSAHKPRKAKTMKKRKSHTRKRRTVARRANPIFKKRRIVRRRRSNPIETVQANPMKKRRSIRRRKNPITLAGVRRRARRTFGAARARGGAVGHVVMPAVTAASGAILLDLLWANLPIPAKAKVGNMQYLAKGIGAVGMVMLAKKTRVVTPKTAEALGVGAMTVVFHDLIRNVLKKSMPGLHLGEYVGDYDGYPALGEYVGNGADLEYRDALSWYGVAGEGENLVPNYAAVTRQAAVAPSSMPAPAVQATAPVHGYDELGEYVGDYGDMYGYSVGEYVGEYVGDVDYI